MGMGDEEGRSRRAGVVSEIGGADCVSIPLYSVLALVRT